MSDYNDVIQAVQDSQSLAQARASAFSDSNPDDAAEANRLSQATGVPPTVVNADLPAFQQQYKNNLTGDIIRNNPMIASYIQSHPLAAQISNDDYGNLDATSKFLGALGKIASQSAKGFVAGVGQGRVGDWTGVDWQDPSVQSAHPIQALLASTATGITDLPEAAMRTISGGITGAAFGAAELYHQMTGSQPPIDPEAASQAVQDPGLWASLGPVGELIGLPFEIAGFNKALKPTIDKARLQVNQSALEILDNAVKEAQKSTTKERAPELFQGFVEQHVADHNMEISGQRVLELYGDKIPEPDDGVLGWVPNIAEQLEVARDTGADISIPLKDYITKIDPAVHKELQDDLRVVKGGMTNREAAEQLPPVPSIDEAVPTFRNATSLEPLFSIGDRKLTLQRMAEDKVSPNFGQAQGFHDFDMVNENGQSVGTLNLSESQGGKQLHVDMINGEGDYYHPNNFGPALMRDLLRQIKAQFPNAEVLTGHRVSGARDKAGTFDLPSALPKIRLDAPQGWATVEGHEKFSELLGGAWKPISQKVEAYIKPEFAEHEQELVDAVDAEIGRLAPKGVESLPVSEMRKEGMPGGPQGAYLQYSGRLPVIAYSLNALDSLGVARHEVIHHLRRAGFFKPEEWSVLEKAAKDEGWLEKYGIDKRYPALDEEGKLEEAVADGFRNWMNEIDVRSRQPEMQRTLVDGIFQKFRDFLEAIKQHVRRITGTDNFDDIFQRVDQGEVGSREGTRPLDERAFFSEPPIREPGQGIDVNMPFRAAKDVGMELERFKLYRKTIEAQQQADLKASAARVTREQTKRQTETWKAQSEAMRPQVVADLNARPDIAADKFFGLGELLGQKLDKTYRLDWDALTPEQRKMIPESYTVRKGGVKPDEVANLFGYQTGDQMLAGLSKITQAREVSKMRRDRFDRQLIDTEIQRRMEQEHGFLEKNIAEETRDQVLSENQLDLLHEETTHLALLSGEKGFDLTREQLTTQLKEKFDQLPVGSVSSEKFLREVGKQGKIAELSLLQDKPADAFKAKQVQYFNTIYAKFAAKLEAERAKLDKAAKPFRKAGMEKKIEPEYLNHIQDLLQQGGYKVGRSLENIQENLERRGNTLEQFANAKLAESYGYRDIPIADVIVDGKVKPVDQMTTHDFLGYKQTVDALIKNARDEQKIIREGISADRKDVLDDMKSHIERFPLRKVNASTTLWDKIKEVPNTFIAGLTNMETFLNRMGDRDPNSVFNKYVTFPAAAAANRKAALQREFSSIYRGIGEVKDKDKLVASPLIDPLSGQPFARFTRGNVAQMLHNAGNKSNWTVLAKGYGADPEALMHWLVANTTKEDWARAQQLGKEVFGKLIALADQEYEHIHGITIDKLKLEPIVNAHGTFEGWYHPLVKDPLREGKSPIRDGAYDDGDFGHITTANGYTKKRTGAAYPLDLNPDMTPVRMNQMIHDISFRSFVLETQKLFKDSGLSNTITAHYGAEYNGRSFLVPWLKGIAGQESIPSRAAAKANQISEFLRQNVISTYIGFNPFTAMKHGPTALVMSMRQVGPMNFLRAVQDLYGRSPSMTQANHEFVMQWSEEVQRRERHWQDTIFGAHGEIEGANSLREHVIEKGSWLVAKSDMLSAKPTWLASYRNGQADGLTHGEAIDRANADVRMAHGSTAITNQPGLVRGHGPLNNWLTSVYGFFGTAMQRRIELAQDIHDTFGLAKQVELNKAASNIPSIMVDVFTYVIWPTIVEEQVTGLTTDDRRGWLEHVASASLLGLSSSVLYARDIVNGLVSGHDVGVGLISSPLHDVVKAIKDVTRKDALTRERMGKTVGDTLTALGHTTGMTPKTIDNAIHFGIDLVNNAVHPHGAGDWLRGITKGTPKERVEK